ncbi:MAG: [FeFe] hydrogenase H-cluster radical SAM maturase HydE [bacterium]|nr:[FeFe] hydrogenase H-cluster radical SAM maturase HydE [bacterium]
MRNDMTNRQRIDMLNQTGELTKEEWVTLISTYTEEDREYAAGIAKEIANTYYGNEVYIRGLIEFTSYCKNDCYYCGLRRNNSKAQRYRLTEEDIYDSCKMGYELGFRTFVLQGGEDAYFTDERLVKIIRTIKKDYPDCAITMSIGERSYESYKKLYEAGADRYLLRHETANDAHYNTLHPEEMLLSNRKKCLFELKEIGFQVGCGFMVGSPNQTPETLAEDMMFIHELGPHMVGIGPFIPHKDTPFHDQPAGTLEMTLFFLSLIRIMQKSLLLPATTALGTISKRGRELGVLAGANVCMPNLSPVEVRKKYMLYDNKICTGDEAAECRQCLNRRMESIGYQVAVAKGDSKFEENVNN